MNLEIFILLLNSYQRRKVIKRTFSEIIVFWKRVVVVVAGYEGDILDS
jgi:hypothetical protein